MTIRPEDALAALAGAQEHSLATLKLVQELRCMIGAQNTPPRVTPFALSAAQPVHTEEVRHAFASFTVVNPTSAPVFLGIDGTLTAREGNRTPSVPPQSLLTLPIPVERLDLGAAASDLVTGDVVGWLLLHHSIQTPFLGST